MRKLATALNANPMSLYHHVPNKEAVLAGVARTIGAQFRTATHEDLSWQDRIRQLAEDFRTLANRHPELMIYSFGRPEFLQPEDPFWLGLTTILEDAGVSQQDTPQVAACVCAAVIGVLIAEINGTLDRWASLPPATPPTGQNLKPAEDAEDSPLFSLALEMIIAGLENRPLSDPSHKTRGSQRDKGGSRS